MNHSASTKLSLYGVPTKEVLIDATNTLICGLIKKPRCFALGETFFTKIIKDNFYISNRS